jgi:NADPH2:quinone reductase
MRAAVCPAYGEVELVEMRDVDVPTVGPGQVRVAVEAAAANFPDVLVVANKYQLSVPPPFSPGSEFAGVVVETARDVASPVVGQRVFGSTLYGAFAEQIVVAAASVTRVPAGVDARHAAAFGVAHRTAYHTLRSVGRVSAGDDVIVLGAGGGVGLAAVQLGAALGATVTAVASSAEKLDAAKQQGATHLVNHTEGPLRESLKTALPGGADIVVDPVGGRLSEPALRSLRWGGRFVTVGFAAGDIPRIPLNLVLLKGVEVVGFEFRGFFTHHAEEAVRNDRELMDLLAAGQATPHIGATFSLEDTVAALRYVADGRAIGKVLITVS